MYVDGWILPLPKGNIEKYKELAEKSSSIWLKHGALEYHECVADDVSDAEIASFPKSVQLKDDEIVVFAWVIYESKEKRDQANQKIFKELEDEGFAMKDAPFDGNRMISGGFKPLVSKIQ